MFLLDDGTVVHSPSDLTAAATCELAVLRALDVRLGRVERTAVTADAMLARTARLGDAHEQQVLQRLLAEHGPWDPATGRGVVEIERPEGRLARDPLALTKKQEETLAALEAGADVVFQAGFFDGHFSGWADFLVRDRDAEQSTGGGPVYAVYDAKLARHAKVQALLQLAAYGDRLATTGIRVADHAHLILGDRTVTSHRLVDLVPVYRERWDRLEAVVARHRAQEGPARWGDPGLRACGRCEVCVPEVEAARDVLLVAGLRTTQRSRLLDAGISTVEDLAASTGAVTGIGGSTLTSLRAQAVLQARQDASVGAAVVHDLFDVAAVAALPQPDAGDIFFDFEGDPLWAEQGSSVWGLEYLFGLVEAPQEPSAEPVFRAFWAHDRAQEKRALVDFLAFVTQRRAEHPGMHVYHYAPYEKTALLRLAGRHGVGEDVVDALLREGVLVDLYATVRASLRTGQRSYSIKKLEPLYMPGARDADGVTNAADSIVEYAEACDVREHDPDQWQRRLDQIAQYNADDCVSTLRLRDWLLARAAEQGAHPTAAVAQVAALGEVELDAPEQDTLALTLRAFAEHTGAEHAGDQRTDDQQAVAMLAACLGYHWREEKPYWWAHFDRLSSEPAEWTEKRSTVVADEVTVVTPWHIPPGKRSARRTLRLVGTLEPGSDVRAGAGVVALYEPPFPPATLTSENGRRGWRSNVTVLEVGAEPSGDRDSVLVEESVPVGAVGHGELPMALAPGRPPQTGKLAQAIRAVGEQVAGQLPELPPQPALDILRRRPPRTRSGRSLPPVVDGPRGYIDAITAALLDLDGSYLAVQGPPGTGKTYTGARVVARLVEQGWRIGVVAQSHAVVENMLRAVAGAGLSPELIGKRPAGSDPDPDAPWRWLVKDPLFAQFYAAQGGGYVVGGTMWDFTNAARLPAEPFDLLVVDEAGQFALANTVAVSGAARNLLLLGDPQQLPQVSQGVHPEPVDRSALGWITDGHDTLPDELGYFLAQSWRMHPALCAAISRLSYEGRLTSVPAAAERHLAGIEPGVHEVLVPHRGNAVSAREEADAIARIASDLVGRRWTDPSTHRPAGAVDRPLAAADLVVVAAYNAQVWTVRRALDAAGLHGVRVGTVDKFQGQEAPVVLVSMSASSADDVPRGMEFLLDRHRVNVAVSRGQWCAYVVRSPGLTDHLPTSPAGLAELGAFIGLSKPALTCTSTATVER